MHLPRFNKIRALCLFIFICWGEGVTQCFYIGSKNTKVSTAKNNLSNVIQREVNYLLALFSLGTK